jgi:hypothetical protein
MGGLARHHSRRGGLAEQARHILYRLDILYV